MSSYLFDNNQLVPATGTQSTDFSFYFDSMYDKSRKATGQTRHSSRISKSTESPTSASPGYQGESNSKTRYNKGVIRPDFVLLKVDPQEQESNPCILFEVKSSLDLSTTSQGVAQLLSFGIELRHSEKLKHSLYLVFINSSFWGIMVLPPFGEEWNDTIKFYHIPMCLGIRPAKCFLIKENLVWVIQLLIEIGSGKPTIHLD